MKSTTLRLYQTLHTWVGLMAGWALFIAFFAGSLTVFHEELHAWQNPLRAHHAAVASKPADVDHFVNALVRTHPAAAASAYVIFPNEGEPEFSAYWQNSKGDWQMTTGSGLAAGKTSSKDLSIEPSKGELANFLNRLHYSLGLEEPGMYFMGVISVLYGVALISGVLLHLPRLKKDLLAVRPGRNLKRFWMDVHNVLGLFSLPFHLIFAITAPVLCLSVVLMAVFNTMALKGKMFDAVPRVTTAAGTVVAAGFSTRGPAPMLPAEQLLARAREVAAPNFTVKSIHYQHIGDANAVAEVRGSSTRAVGDYGSVAIHAAANQPDSGKLVGNQTPDTRDANHALYSLVYGLHFGTYGDIALRLAYLVMGLAGAFVFYSGNLLWIESRRKQRKTDQPRAHLLLARATVGVCIGCCVGVMATFPAALLWPERSVGVTYYSAFFAAIAWAMLRPPARGAVELLSAAAIAAVLAPITNAVVTGDHLWRTIARGDWMVAGFDLGALALACGFVGLARATLRRARHGAPDSVWAMPVRRSGTSARASNDLHPSVAKEP